MTAVEFAKIRLRFITWWPFPSLFLALGIAAWSTFHMIHGGTHGDNLWFFLVIVGPAIGSVALVAGGALFLERRFERQHPEMANLWEWCRLVGTEQNYPAEKGQWSAAANYAAVNLADHARTVNAMIEARNAIQVTLPRHENGSVEAVVLANVRRQLADEVNDAMNEYKARWELLTGKMSLLFGERYADSRKYRESFLKQSRVGINPEGEM